MVLRSALWISAFVALSSSSALAAVSPEEASKLKTSLTPVGAERAGSADGSIPAWTGGMVGKSEDYFVNGRRIDPFAGEKPLFSITSSNMSQYGDKLTDGTKGMFAKYPDTFRIDVYKTQRAAAMPQWFYDATYQNATSTSVEDKGDDFIPVGYAAGGVPFPIPKDGRELIWNHLIRWNGVAHQEQVDAVLITSEGHHVLTAASLNQFYYPNMVASQKGTTQPDGMFFKFKTVNSGPPIRTGEGLVVYNNVDSNLNRAWVYLTGQRRVRMLPNACCDTPSPASAGVMSFDEFYVFANKPTRFDWKILGKKEIYIPYNSNKTLVPNSYDAIMSVHHLNPDQVRWELHRVWVVEATLRQGQRHVAPRSVYYFDEDNWIATLGDRYDSDGKLWKMMWDIPVAMPDVPGEIPTDNGFYDLASGAWFVSNIANAYNIQYDFKNTHYSDGDFTPESLSSEGVR